MKRIALINMLGHLKRISIILLVATSLANIKVLAQNKFEPIVTVNNRIVSHYELSQRLALLNVLQPNRISRKQVLKNLINERLLEQFSEQFKIKISEKKIEEELSVFANQFNVSNDVFLEELKKLNISKQTITSFLRNRILLTEVVYFKFSNRAAISIDEVDSYIINGKASVELNLAEIVLPFGYDNKEEILNLVSSIKNRLSEGGKFESIAKEYSKSPTAINGGDIGWVPISQMPIDLGNKLLTANINEIIGPEIIENIVVLYKLIAMRDVPLFNSVNTELDYIEVSHSSESKLSLKETVVLFEDNDNCLNLQFKLKNYESLSKNLTRTVVSSKKIDKEKLNYLEKLDSGEMALIGSNKQSDATLLMLCSRQQEISKSDRELARQFLISQRLNFLADGLLADLKSEAKIIYK
ncbi:MAG: peptidylprolyl isomerase [Paracoccaceae bacterium]